MFTKEKYCNFLSWSMTLEVIVFQFFCQQLSLSLHVSKWENLNSRLTLDMWTTSSPNVQSQKPMKRIVFAPVSWPPLWTCSGNSLNGITGTVGELWMGKVGHCLIPSECHSLTGTGHSLWLCLWHSLCDRAGRGERSHSLSLSVAVQWVASVVVTVSVGCG